MSFAYISSLCELQVNGARGACVWFKCARMLLKYECDKREFYKNLDFITKTRRLLFALAYGIWFGDAKDINQLGSVKVERELYKAKFSDKSKSNVNG